MRGEIRKCPVCGVAIPRGKLMCLTHWRAIPSEMRQAVNRTWREFKRSDYGQPAIVALGEYRIAADAAVRAAAEKERIS